MRSITRDCRWEPTESENLTVVEPRPETIGIPGWRGGGLSLCGFSEEYNLWGVWIFGNKYDGSFRSQFIQPGLIIDEITESGVNFSVVFSLNVK